MAATVSGRRGRRLGGSLAPAATFARTQRVGNGRTSVGDPGRVRLGGTKDQMVSGAGWRAAVGQEHRPLDSFAPRPRAGRTGEDGGCLPAVREGAAEPALADGF